MRSFLVTCAFLAAAFLAAVSGLPEKPHATFLQSPTATAIRPAATFNGSSSFYVSDTLAFGVTRTAVSVWVNWTTFANNDSLMFEYSANHTANSGTFLVDPNSADTNFAAGVTNPSTNTSTSELSSRPSAGAWHHYAFNFSLVDSVPANQLAIYIDGTLTSPFNSGTATGPANFGSFPLYVMSRGGASLFAAGAVCQLAVWSGLNLTGGDVTSLAAGASPSTIESGPKYFWHMDGSTDSNLGSGGTANMTPTATGTTVSIPSVLTSC